MPKEKLRDQETLTFTETLVYDLIARFKEESGDTLGNRELADLLEISRNEVSKLRVSVATKLGLKKGF